MKRIAFLLILIGIAILGIVGTLAWYTNVAENNSTLNSMQAEDTLSAEIVSQMVEQKNYNGATGRGPALEEDAPYTVKIYINLQAHLGSNRGFLRVEIPKMIVNRGTLEELPHMETVENVSDHFTFRVIYKEESFVADEEGYLFRERDNAQLQLDEGENNFYLQLIYLSEDRYQQWLADCERSYADYQALLPPLPYFEWVKDMPEYFNYPDFRFSDPKYMRTFFFFDIRYEVRMVP